MWRNPVRIDLHVLRKVINLGSLHLLVDLILKGCPLEKLFDFEESTIEGILRLARNI